MFSIIKKRLFIDIVIGMESVFIPSLILSIASTSVLQQITGANVEFANYVQDKKLFKNVFFSLNKAH